MTSAGRHTNSPTAAPTRKSGAYIFARAREADLEPISLPACIAAMPASSALVSSSRHARNVLELACCPREIEEERRISPDSFAAPEALQ